MRRVLLAVLLLGLAAPARAASTQFVDVGDAYTDLGAGPMQMQAQGNNPDAYVIADAPPASGASGFTLIPGQAATAYTGASHVYVRSSYGGQPGRVLYAPLTAASVGSVTTAAPLAGGTGGITPLTLGTAVTTSAVPAAGSTTRRSLLVTNQSTTATGTFCPASGGVTPAANAAGCYTLLPNGGFLSYPAEGYVPQDAFNASASSANVPFTVEVH